MKESGKTKPFLCFRPAVTVVGKENSGRKLSNTRKSDMRSVGKISSAHEGKKYDGKSCFRDSVLSYITVPDGSLQLEADDSRSQKMARSIFVRVYNAIAFQRRAKKKRKGKNHQSSNDTPSKNLLPEICQKLSENSPPPPESDGQKMEPTTSSSDGQKIERTALSSSSFSSTTSSRQSRIPRSDSEVCIPNSRKEGPRIFSSASGLYFLVISLSVMILWGRLCAIICTSTWLFLALRRKFDTPRFSPPDVTVKPPEMESKEYKKRVIMEGLLERSHSRA